MAETIFIKGEGGAVFEMSLPLHPAIAQRLSRGHVRRVQPDGSPYVESERPDAAPSLPTTRPAVNAAKAEWVGWAVVQGLTPDDAEALTKTDLIERYGQAPTEPETTPETAAETPAE